jgi:hypothetical protein
VPARVVRKDMLHNGSALDHLITALRGASSWEIFFGWVRLHVLFWLGVSPERLAEIYRARRRGGRSGRHQPTRQAFCSNVERTSEAC